MISISDIQEELKVLKPYENYFKHAFSLLEKRNFEDLYNFITFVSNNKVVSLEDIIEEEMEWQPEEFEALKMYIMEYIEQLNYDIEHGEGKI